MMKRVLFLTAFLLAIWACPALAADYNGDLRDVVIREDSNWWGGTLSGTLTIEPGVTLKLRGGVRIGGEATIRGGGTIERATAKSDMGEGLITLQSARLTLDGVCLRGRNDSRMSLIRMQESQLMLNNVVIENNQGNEAGAIVCDGYMECPVEMTDCVVRDCRGRNAGAIWMPYGTLRMTNCEISGNYASDGVGGLSVGMTGNQESLIRNSTIADNIGLNVGGLGGNTIRLENSAVTGNRATGDRSMGGTKVQNLWVYGNSTVTGNTAQGWTRNHECSDISGLHVSREFFGKVGLYCWDEDDSIYVEQGFQNQGNLLPDVEGMGIEPLTAIIYRLYHLSGRIYMDGASAGGDGTLVNPAGTFQQAMALMGGGKGRINNCARITLQGDQVWDGQNRTELIGSYPVVVFRGCTLTLKNLHVKSVQFLVEGGRLVMGGGVLLDERTSVKITQDGVFSMTGGRMLNCGAALSDPLYAVSIENGLFEMAGGEIVYANAPIFVGANGRMEVGGDVRVGDGSYVLLSKDRVVDLAGPLSARSRIALSAQELLTSTPRPLTGRSPYVSLSNFAPSGIGLEIFQEGDHIITLAVPDRMITVPSDVQLEAGETRRLSVRFSPVQSVNWPLQWQSDDPSVVVVDQDGWIRATGEGVAHVTASLPWGNLQAQCEVAVGAQGTPVDPALSVLALVKGSTLRLPVLEGYDGQWTSANPSIVSLVDGGKKIKGVARGRAVLRYNVSSVSAVAAKFDGRRLRIGEYYDVDVYVITKKQVPKKVVPSAKTVYLSLYSQPSQKLSAVVSPAAARVLLPVFWKSEDPNVAAVSEDGVVMAVSPGRTKATVYTVNGKKAQVNLVVTDDKVLNLLVCYPDGMAVKSTAKIRRGTRMRLVARAVPSAADTTVRWLSSKPTVISIDPVTGELTALKKGAAIITAIAQDGSGVRGTAKFKVVK